MAASDRTHRYLRWPVILVALILSFCAAAQSQHRSGGIDNAYLKPIAEPRVAIPTPQTAQPQQPWSADWESRQQTVQQYQAERRDCGREQTAIAAGERTQLSGGCMIWRQDQFKNPE